MRYEPVNTLEKAGFAEIVNRSSAHIIEHVLTGAMSSLELKGKQNTSVQDRN